MDSLLLVALVLLAIVALVLFLRFRKKSAIEDTSLKGRYRAVTVKWHMGACEAVKSLHGKRFIGSEAPSFPLPECNASECNCRYQFHGDRREGERRLPGTMQEKMFVVNASEENRTRRDRRRP